MLGVTHLSGFSGGGGASASGYETETEAYLARTTGMTTDCKDDINALILSLKQRGLWSYIDVLCVAGAADTGANAEANALQNIKANQYNATNPNGATFTQDQGFTIAKTGNKYIDTNFVYNFGVTEYKEDHSTLGVYVRSHHTESGKTSSYIGHASSVNDSSYIAYDENVSDFSFTSEGRTFARTSALGSVAMSRYQFLCPMSNINGSQLFDCGYPDTYNVPTTYSVYVGALNDQGSLAKMADGAQIAAWWIGTDNANYITTDINDYFDARGTGVHP